MTTLPTAREHGFSLAAALALIYALMIVYVSLEPFSNWRAPDAALWSFLSAPWPRYYTRFDLIINFLAYAPLGFLGSLSLQTRLRPANSALAAAVFALLLSVFMESAQTYLPGRVASNLDVLANSAGAACGAFVAARLGGRLIAGGPAASARMRWFLPGTMVDFGLVLLAVWFVGEANPAVPLFSLWALPADARPPAPFGPWDIMETAAAFFKMLSVALFISLLLRNRRSVLGAALILTAAAMAIKMFVAAAFLKTQAIFQWLHPGALTGLALGLGLMIPLSRLARQKQIYLCVAGITVISGLRIFTDPEAGMRDALGLFDWNYAEWLYLDRLAQLISVCWSPLALAYLCAFSLKYAADKEAGS